MLSRRSFMQAVMAGGACAALSPLAHAFTHSTELPALAARVVGQSPFLAVSRAGQRLVAVGIRGQIALSDDDGASWRAASSPVSVDLVALHFPSEKMGWAVGHGGVVLHSADGGLSWVRQLEGRRAAEISGTHLARRLEVPGIDRERYQRLLEDEKWLQESGGMQPFLDVHFEDERTGHVVGTFNRIFHTRDGGRSWEAWIDRIDNPSSLHINAAAGAGGTIYLAGEQGAVWRKDAGAQGFVLMQTPYDGTLFGLAVLGPRRVLAFGMRGNVFRSEDGGEGWQPVRLSGHGGVTGATRLASGEIVLVTQAGTVERSRDEGRSFAPVKMKAPMAYADVVEARAGVLVLAGAEGLRTQALA